MSQKLFCPKCGNEMIYQEKLYGKYKFHDVYYGCKSCNECWEVKEDGHGPKIKPVGKLTDWLKDENPDDKKTRDAVAAAKAMDAFRP